MTVSGDNEDGMDTLPAEIRKEIRKEAVQQVAKYTIAGVVALIAIAGAGWLLYLKDKAPYWFNGVPAGAIMAFDLNDSCPDGWGWTSFEAAQGRFIVGSGENDGIGKRAFRIAGGSDTHKLAKDELPSIPFTYNLTRYNGDHWMPGSGGDVVGLTATTELSGISCTGWHNG